MQAAEFYRAVTKDSTGVYDLLLDILDREGIAYCLVGGQGVNAYVSPLVSLDVDFVIAADELPRALEVFAQHFKLETFPNTINISASGSSLRAQIQMDPRYAPFVARAARREVLGRTLPVAAIEDLLQGKIWAAGDPGRRGSKRQKDLADIARIIETYPALRESVPVEILARLE